MRAPLKFSIAILLAALLGCSAPGAPAQPAPRVAAALPISGTTLLGQPLTIAASEHPTLLVFWASWCASCRAEAPSIEALHRDSAVPLRVVGVNVDETPPNASQFVASAGLSFPSLSDPDLAIADRFGISGTPTLVLLGPRGNVLARGHHLDDAEIAAALAPFAAPPADPRGTASLHHESELPTVTRSAVLMGTDIDLLVLTEDRARAESAIDVALGEMARIEALMTDWTDASQVAAIGHSAGKAPVAVDSELLDLLVAARGVSELTDGKFDVTWAAAWDLWDFRADTPRLPSESEVEAAIRQVGYRDLVLDEQAGTAFLRRPGMRVGLGAIAKGYAVDRAVGVLEAAGFEDFAVNAGGDLAVRGRKGQELWWVSIRDPRDADNYVGVLPVSNLSVVTSGDYERYLEIDGVRYCHIIDPATGWPAQGTRSVTVMASRTWWADALATGIFVLGARRGLELLESLEGVEGLIVDAFGELHLSSGLQSPTDSRAQT